MTDIEIREIPGFEDYGVDRDGNVWNIRTQKILKQDHLGTGYGYVRLVNGDEKSKRRVNRLVAEAFVEKPEGWTTQWHAHHINHDALDNRADNLVWVSPEAHRAEHGAEQSKRVRCIDTGEIFESTIAAARALGVRQGGVSYCCNGRYKSTLGYHFEFVD